MPFINNSHLVKIAYIFVMPELNRIDLQHIDIVIKSYHISNKSLIFWNYLETLIIDLSYLLLYPLGCVVLGLLFRYFICDGGYIHDVGVGVLGYVLRVCGYVWAEGARYSVLEE